MSEITTTQSSSPPWVNRLIVTLLSASLFAAAAAGLGVWKQSALIDQRITNIDNKHLRAISELDKKYTERSSRVINRVGVLASSLSVHFSDDNAHRLSIQKTHLTFEGFMKQLDTAHQDIETLKHRINLMQQGCCRRINGEMK